MTLKIKNKHELHAFELILLIFDNALKFLQN